MYLYQLLMLTNSLLLDNIKSVLFGSWNAHSEMQEDRLRSLSNKIIFITKNQLGEFKIIHQKISNIREQQLAKPGFQIDLDLDFVDQYTVAFKEETLDRMQMTAFTDLEAKTVYIYARGEQRWLSANHISIQQQKANDYLLIIP